jgi:hypothetical protein
MTGYTVHTGSTVKFSEGWDQIFGSGSKKTGGSVQAKTKSSKKPASAKKQRARRSAR